MDDVGKELLNYINTYDESRLERLSDEITSAHPTIQQRAFKLMIMCMEKWANMEQYDGRNATTIESAKKITEIISSKQIRMV